MASESVFHAAVRTIFTNWTALQLAIQHGMGGPYAREKERWLADAAVQYFHDNVDLQPDEVEEFINDILNNEFDTIADDGSVEEISRKLCQFHRWCQEGHESLVLENLPKSCTTRTGTNSSQCVTEQMQNLSLEHTTNDAPTESTPDSETPLEEGWTVVRRSKNR